MNTEGVGREVGALRFFFPTHIQTSAIAVKNNSHQFVILLVPRLLVTLRLDDGPGQEVIRLVRRVEREPDVPELLDPLVRHGDGPAVLELPVLDRLGAHPEAERAVILRHVGVAVRFLEVTFGGVPCTSSNGQDTQGEGGEGGWMR